MSRFLFFIVFINFFLINSTLSETIKDININGNKRISNQTVVVLGDINLNTNYDLEKLNLLTKELYKTNFFKDVNVSVKNNILIVDLIENPIIEDIQINGIKKKQVTDTLLEKIFLKNRKSFSEFYLDRDINLIKNILKSNGYYFVDVSASIETNDALNSVRVILTVNQGPRAKIKKISFIGDKKIKNKKLLEVIASEEHKFWKIISNNVYLDQSRVDLDKRLIENFYKDRGYYNVKVLNSFAELDKFGNFNLVFNINAGEIFYFNDFKLNLPEDYNPKDFNEINKYFEKIKGETYSLNSFEKILNQIESIANIRLYDFIDAKVDEEIIDNNKINFTFNISDSTKFYVKNINIFGNFNTIEEVIRNNLIVDEGDPLNKILFNKSINDIRSLGIFKNVEYDLIDSDVLNLKNININVEEIPTGEISLAAGVGTSGTTIGGGIVEKNFLGRGINLSTNLEISESSLKGQFIYSKPNFAYTDNTLFTSFKSVTTDNLTDYGYKVSEISSSIGTEFEQYENLFFNPSIEISLEDLETNSTASNSLIKQQGNYTDLYFNYGLKYDKRNSKFRTTSGNQTNFFQEIPLISDNIELINTLVFTQYKKLLRESEVVGKGSFYFKSVNSLDGNKDVRISNRSQVPYNRLRGFKKGKIGPISNGDYIGGNYVSTINLSSDLPFILPTVDNIDFSIFFDAANIWGVDYDKNIDGDSFIRSSAGIGMNFITPVGPLSFSLSQPISKKSTDQTETFRFNLGTTF